MRSTINSKQEVKMQKNEFPLALRAVIFLIEGKEGYWKQVPYRDAKDNPQAFRASSNGKNVSWFVPSDLFDVRAEY